MEKLGTDVKQSLTASQAQSLRLQFNRKIASVRVCLPRVLSNTVENDAEVLGIYVPTTPVSMSRSYLLNRTYLGLGKAV